MTVPRSFRRSPARSRRRSSKGLGSLEDDLNSVELSRRYQSSCTPIREALMPLEKDGSSTFRRGAGLRASLAIDETRDIYRARAALFELSATAKVGRAL